MSKVTINVLKTFGSELCDCIFSVVIFNEPINCVAAGGSEGNHPITLYSTKTFELLKVIKEGKRNVLKWDNSTFLASGSSKTMLAISGISGEWKIIKRFESSDHIFGRIAKLDDDRILTLNGSGHVQVFSFKKECFLPEFSFKIRHVYYPDHIISKIDPTCFFVIDGSGHAKLGSIKEKKIIKMFKEEDSNMVYNMETYINSKKQEILVYGGYQRRLLFYHNDLSEGQRHKDGKLIRLIEYNVGDRDHWVGSISVFQGKYLVFGTSSGGVFSLDVTNLENKTEKDIIKENVDIHGDDWVDMIRLVDIEDDYFTVISSGNNSKLNLLKINGVNLVDKKKIIARNDLMERIGYIFDESSEFVSNEEEKKELFFEIKFTYNNNSLVCTKSIM